MIKDLKNKFIQGFAGTLIWLQILITLFVGNLKISNMYFWNLIGIAAIFSFIFGVVYTYLWNYSTFKAVTNIIISTIVNTVGGILALFIFSKDMYYFINRYIIYIFIITLIGHIIGFYFYSKYEKNKLSNELNTLIK